MNHKHFVLPLAVALTVVSIGAFLWLPGGTESAAQGPGGVASPQGDVAITAGAVNSRINYQGILQENGNPVTGSRDMTFRFYLTGDCSGVYVAEKSATGFTVAELRGGASNATFDSMPRCSGHWEVAARRKGYEDVRLAPVTAAGP